MPVYMIQAGGPTGPVKIGYGDPRRRLIGCQVGNHEDLRIIRVFDGGADAERMLHERFSAQHLRGEWHEYSDAMLEDVGLVALPIPQATVPNKRPQHWSLIERIGGHKSVASALGIREAVVCHWKSRGIPPFYWQYIEDLARARNEEGITVETLRAGRPNKIHSKQSLSEAA
jgi:hypothetical protein